LIAGIVEIIRFAGPEHNGTPMSYRPVSEESPPRLTFVARVGGDAGTLFATCRDAVRAVAVPVLGFGNAACTTRRRASG
jgi:hypothetical protein